MEKLSLLDMGAPKLTVQWHVIYTVSDRDHWWVRWLKPKFEHCMLAKAVPYGPQLSDRVWLIVDPCPPMILADMLLQAEPPWVQNPDMTVQRVVAVTPVKKVREAWAFGPPTCVETVKACLGIKSFWTRTPWQLYQHIAARGGVLISE